MRAVAPRAVRVIVIGLLLAAGWTEAARADDAQSYETIERGRYLARVGDCTACHTAPGGKLFSGGLKLSTPFGTLLAPNITPDRATGIGTLSDAEFVDSLQRGTGYHGQHLYPAMPYAYYTHVTRDDALAIRAYLNTVEPVSHPVVANQLPFPFSIRPLMIVWNALFFHPGALRNNPARSATWNRGAYLVEGLGHCGMCHTPKTLLGSDRTGNRLQGYALQGWFAPAITTDARRGIGTWSVDDLVLYLKTGRNRFDIASGPMAEAVMDETSQMSMADLRAIAVYLRDEGSAGAAPVVAEAPAVGAGDPVMKAGAAIYADNCAACHTGNGAGIVGLFPQLAGAPLVQQSDATSLLHVVLHGNRAVATDGAPTGPAMPAFGWRLTDAQVAAVVTYIRNSWGNAAPAVDAAAARRVRATAPDQG